MSLPVPSFHSNSPPIRTEVPKAHWSASAALAQNPALLDQILEQARQHLALRLQGLPEPWPGCVLVFSVAHANELATVFPIKAHTFQSAWREGSIRVRQWAWARRLESAALRIDWAEEVLVYPAGHQLSASGIEQLRRSNSAFADLGCEHTLLLQQALLAPAADLPAWAGAIIAGHAARESWLVLRMRGIFLDPYSTAPIHLPRNSLAPLQGTTAPAGMDMQLHHAGQAALVNLIAQQMPAGHWPQSSTLAEHLQIQYSLLQLLRAEPAPRNTSTLAALVTALARASNYAASALPQDAQEQAWALLVLSLSAAVLNHSAAPQPQVATALRSLAQQTEQALASTQPQPAAPSLHNPTALGMLQRLALRTYARISASTTSTSSANPSASDLPHSDWPANWLHLLAQPFANAHHHCPPWLSCALIEACQDPAARHSACQLSPLERKRTLEQLDALHQHFAWPETAIYIQQRQQMHMLFTTAPWPTVAEQSQLGLAQQALWLNQASACVALLHGLASTAPASGAARNSDTAHTASSPAPMPWSGQSMASLMAGQWHLPQGMSVPATLAGLSVTRQSHSRGAAVLVRHTGDVLGVPAAVTASLQPSALIQVTGHPVPPDLPVLEVADLHNGLQCLAGHARQRVQGQVIGVTGCTGKTSTLRMLAQCLFGSSSAQQDAIVQHAPALQMLHWSETAPWLLAELPWQSAPDHLQLLAPDILVVTNLPPAPTGDDGPPLVSQTEQALQALMSAMRPGSLLILNACLLPPETLQTLAARAQIRLSTFGAQPGATVYEYGWEDSGQLHIRLQPAVSTDTPSSTPILRIELQANGHHMALNAQAALAALLAMQLPLANHAIALRHWSPLPGAGQSEYLPGNRVMLDHSSTSELLAAQAAFAQLLSHSPDPSQRLIVLGGIKACAQQADSLLEAQMLLAPLLQSTPARRVLLYGQAMADLAQQLHGEHQVSWYQDLNQLIDSLLRALQPHDTVLLFGRAIVNLNLVAVAIRELAA